MATELTHWQARHQVEGAAPPRNKDKDSAPPSTASANNTGSDDFDEAVTIMPEYWDALELAQYLKSKQLGSYAQVVVYEQITGKVLLDTPAPKLRKLFEDVDTSADDPSWKAFQNECVKLKSINDGLKRPWLPADRCQTLLAR